MLLHDAIVKDAYYWERIGFRAAWVSVTQVPLVYLLAMKSSIIGFLSGSSHERLNWLHRWVSRTLLITVTIHGGFFWREWWMADFISLELSIMPMVKYGLGAWFLLIWTTVSSLAPLRKLSYELFVVQHLAAAGVFLWLLWVHVPSYAQYNIWFAVAAVSCDKLFLWGLTAFENFSIWRATKLGHKAEIRSIESNITEVIVHDVGFSWKAGQHIYLRLPALGPFEAHPFTIANVCEEKGPRSLQLIIKAKKGFTRRLAKSALKHEGSAKVITALVTGPFGNLPDWRIYETLILISASTGASFTLPILDSILTAKQRSCVSRIDLLMIVHNRAHMIFHLPRLEAAKAAAQDIGLLLNISIAITCPCERDASGRHTIEGDCNTSDDDLQVCKCGNKVAAQVLLSKEQASTIQSYEAQTTTSSSSTEERIGLRRQSSCCTKTAVTEDITVTEKDSTSSLLSSADNETTSRQMHQDFTYIIGSRPDVADFIRRPVEATGGETSVVVCGGRSLVAATRNFVAKLSDERAVHKGTGAQGIALHTETYCF